MSDKHEAKVNENDKASTIHISDKGPTRSFFMENSVVCSIIALAILAVACRYVVPPVYHLFCRIAYAYYSNLDIIKGTTIIVALAALMIAWNNYRRGNTAIVKLVEFTYSATDSIGINNSQLFVKLDVRIKNLGIPLKRPHVSLHGHTRYGWLSLPLMKIEDDQPADTNGSLDKGMVAAFALRSFEMKPAQIGILSSLSDPEAFGISLGVFSNGFLVKRFRLQSPATIERLKRKWNSLAGRLSRRFAYSRKRWGRTFVQMPTILPSISDPHHVMDEFVTSLKDDRLNGRSPAKRNGPPSPLFRTP
jgi:hypothetical protein